MEIIEPNPTLASPIERLIAVIIDGLIEGVIAFIPIVGWVASLGYLLTKDSLPFLNGQSIGKRAMGIRVVSEETHLPITGDYATSAFRVVPFFIPLLNIVDALVIFGDKRQRLGDQWAKTIVIKE